MAKSYLGFKETDSQSEYAPFFQEDMAAIPQHVSEQLDAPLAWGTLADIDGMALLENEGDLPIENGYSVAEDGSIAVAVKTLMPGTTPQMWDWWFGWHGSENNRYKLWHPKAHLSAKWEDGRNDNCYIGRTSLIEEYIGDNALDAHVCYANLVPDVRTLIDQSLGDLFGCAIAQA